MASILAEEAGPLATGLALRRRRGCRSAVDRLREWTTALVAWCATHPGLELFSGHCSVHHGQLLTLQGRWDEALVALADSRRRHEQRGDLGAAGLAEGARGDILRLRGQETAAAAAYRTASDLGGDPQPGPSLLWLRQGHTDDSVAAVRRCLAQSPLPAHRIGLLPGAAEVLQWGGVGCPFEVARARVVLARACAAMEDVRTAAGELAAAWRTFGELGASPDDSAAAALEGALPTAPPPGAGVQDGLTPRELDVLALVVAGRSNRQIARALVISDRTVARHLSNIFTKIDVGSRTEAAAYAFRHGLVPP